MALFEASSNPENPITIGFSAEERAGMQSLLGLYGAYVQMGLPPSPARRNELTTLSRLCAKLAVLDTMQDGQTIEIDALDLLIVEHACTFFIAGAPLLPDEQDAQILRVAAQEVQRVVLQGQG